MPSTSTVPIAFLSAAWRSARCRTAKSRFRYRAASSNRCASAASFMRCSSAAERRLCVPREELDDAVDDRSVGLLRHVADARGQAAVDVVVEARDARVPPRLRAFAGPIRKDAVQHVERLAQLLRRGVRAEIDDSAPVALSREHDARIVVPDGHGDVRDRTCRPGAGR